MRFESFPATAYRVSKGFGDVPKLFTFKVVGRFGDEVRLSERSEAFSFHVRVRPDALHETPEAAWDAYVASREGAVVAALRDLDRAREDLVLARKLAAEAIR